METEIEKSVVEGNNYFNIHQWIARHYGKASKCENAECESENPTKFEWALLKGKSYERIISNFIQLCTSCHKKYDFTESKRINMSNAKLNGTANDIAIIAIYPDGTQQEYRSISEASRLSKVGVQIIYNSLNNKPKKYTWKRLTKSSIKWILK